MRKERRHERASRLDSSVARNLAGHCQCKPAEISPDIRTRRIGARGRIPASLRAADAPKYGADGMPHGWVDSPLVFVAIGEDGTVSIVCHRSEMGQGVRTGMPMIVADELEADWSRVRVVQATGDEARYGNQDTDGSRSTRHLFMPMRRCGAAARQMLEDSGRRALESAGQRSSGQQRRGDTHGQPAGKLGYGALAKAAASVPLPAMDKVKLKDPSQFRYIGTGKLKLVDAQDIVTGKTHYGMDTRLPGLLYAVVARPQVYGGTVKSYDAAATLKVPGVVKVVQIEATPGAPEFNPLGGIAVIASNTWAAMQGRKALQIVWDDGPNATYDSVAYRKTLEEAASKPGPVVRNDGDFAKAAAAASKRIRLTTTCRTSRTPRWKPRRRPRASRRASARSGAASSHRRPRATWSRSGSA